MNIFNCFQACAFYTALALATPWLFANGYSVWGWAASIALMIGYVLLSVAVHIATDK